MLRGETAVIHIEAPEFLLPRGPIPEPPEKVWKVEVTVELVQIIQVRDVLGGGEVVKVRLKDGQGEEGAGALGHTHAASVVFR